MRLLLIALCLTTLATAPASGQTWHIDETTLPTPINAQTRPRQAEILRVLKPRIEYHLDDGNPTDLDQAELRKAEENLHVLVLQRSGGQLTFVSGWTSAMCGAVGNCMTWVLDKGNHILLETSGKAITVFPSLHHGRPDLLFSIHDSASDTDRERWRFNGKIYERTWCGTSTMGYPGHEYVHPHTYSHPCQQ